LLTGYSKLIRLFGPSYIHKCPVEGRGQGTYGGSGFVFYSVLLGYGNNIVLVGILGADGLPNPEKFEWKTLGGGAAT
jgi:hypothetical protein